MENLKKALGQHYDSLVVQADNYGMPMTTLDRHMDQVYQTAVSQYQNGGRKFKIDSSLGMKNGELTLSSQIKSI